jgi:hypothetical protein
MNKIRDRKGRGQEGCITRETGTLAILVPEAVHRDGPSHPLGYPKRGELVGIRCRRS